MDGDLKIKLECLSIAWAAGNTISWPLMYALSGYLPSGMHSFYMVYCPEI
ncbi:hypothetical protein IIE26_27655 (plasmid) [Cytobacillus oceanisediminis]|nr:hypothetical protein [Cytobacillus oceanisediminis]QOK29902.1 hypothetical protein IIE26_27655 [Cytobacillus oceanisediminis]